MKKPFKGPLLLCILDGVGMPTGKAGDAFTLANTPTLDNLLKNHPQAQLITHGEDVGLPAGQMGNSEVGHITIGAGRVILQSLDRIRKGLKTEEAYATPMWKTLDDATKSSRAIHLIAMVSDGGVHSHTDHITSLCEKLNAQNKPVFIHAITDGRDTAPAVASQQVQRLEKAISKLENVKIVDIVGRFYAMDRDNRLERMAKATSLYSARKGSEFADAASAIEYAYNVDDVQDEFIEPSTISTRLDASINDGDTLLFANFRADRMRQIVAHYIKKCPNSHIASLTEYDAKFENRVNVLFPPEQPKNTLGEIISNNGGTQLRIAESEKYAHVTFFLNGGREEPFSGESRIVVQSPDVKTYDQAPAMSLAEVTKKLVASIQSKNAPDFICLNIANGDQVGHSGSLSAAKIAMEHIDNAVKIITKALSEHNGEMVLIADHGNCEEMLLDDGSVSTAHSTGPVPLIYFGRPGATIKSGSLADVAPTLLHIAGLEQPAEMTGKTCVKFDDA